MGFDIEDDRDIDGTGKEEIGRGGMRRECHEEQAIMQFGPRSFSLSRPSSKLESDEHS